MSGLLFRVLLSDRLQFLYKVSTLVEMVEDLGKDFQATADRLASGSSKQIDADWEELNAVHYDLNTCLRESNVVLKSFLLVLPDNQVSVLDAEIGRSWQRKLGSDLNDSSLLTADEIAYSREGL